MSQLTKKSEAALHFGRVTRSVLSIQLFERANRFLATHGWRKRPLTHPLAIVIRTTERCFLKCKMCGQNGEQGRLRDVRFADRQRVAPAVYESLCQELPSWPVKPLVKFTGGEPLLEWKVLRPTIEKLRAIGCIIKLNTNGVLLKNPRLAEEVVRSGVDYLSVSIDGNEAVHSEIRGVPSAFRNARKGIWHVIEARRRLRTKYPMILLSCVVSTWNEKQVADMSDVARDFKADWLNVQFLNFLTPERSAEAHRCALDSFGIEEQPWKGFEIPELTRIDPKALSEGIRTIRRSAHCPVSTMKIGGLTEENIHRFFYTDDVVKHHLCHMPFVTAFVVPPGKNVFCIDYPYFFYGDLREQSLASAWFGERAQQFRDKFIQYYQENGKCFSQCLRCNWPYNT